MSVDVGVNGDYSAVNERVVLHIHAQEMPLHQILLTASMLLLQYN